MRSRLPGIAWCLCIGLSGGCAATTSPSVPRPPSEASAGSVTVGEPFSALIEEQQEAGRVIVEAIEHQVEACMRDQGFPYSPRTSPEGQRPPAPIVLGDVERAEIQGFGAVDSVLLSRVNNGGDPEELDTGGMSDDEVRTYEKALNGEHEPSYGQRRTGEPDPNVVIVQRRTGETKAYPRNGCLAQARLEVFDSFEKYDENGLDTILNLIKEIHVMVPEEERYEETEKLRRRCMSDAGYGNTSTGREEYFATFQQKAMNVRRSAAKLAALRKEEVEFAVAATKCDRQTGFGDVLKTLYAEYEEKVSAENQDVIASWLETRSQAAMRAKEILRPK